MRATAGPELLHVGSHRMRVGPWRRGAPYGYLVPLTAPDLLTDDAIDAAVERLAAQGFRSVLTAALLAEEQERFLRRGFVVDRRLHLLHADLDRLPLRRSGRDEGLRRARRWERDRILSVDRLAFDEFWRLDALAFDEARRATPRSRVRVADDDESRIVGYAITGRSGDHGYLQRLAVDPDHQGRGLGRLLVLDALRWLRRHGVRSAAVNTQEHNTRALALYEQVGFRRRPGGLAVLRRDIG